MAESDEKLIVSENGFGDLNFKYVFRDKQLIAVEHIADGKGVLAVLPTGYGKTTIALCVAEYCRQRGLIMIIVSPLKALNADHYKTFLDYGFKVIIADSDNEFDIEEYDEDVNVIILTYEKNDSILRNQSKRGLLYNKVGALLVDEIHQIESEGRGSNLESSILKAKHLYPHIMVVGLSATIGNPERVAEWLNVELVFAGPDERPVPLTVEYVKFKEICYEGSNYPDYQANLSFKMEVARRIVGEEKGNFIIFHTSRRRTSDFAKFLSDKTTLKSMMLQQNGVVYHNAGLKKDEREAIEQLFKARFLRGINSTPTLAQGVNLPARVVIVSDTEQYSALRGQEILDANRLQQTMGRAGRPGYDDEGKVFIIVPDRIYDEVKERAEYPFDLYSRIPENAKEIVLEWIVSNVARKPADLIKISNNCLNKFDIKETIGWLAKKGFIYEKDAKYEPSFIGRMTSLLYIKPETTLNYLRAKHCLDDDSSLIKVMVEMLATAEYTDAITVRSEDSGKIEYARRFVADIYPNIFQESGKRLSPELLKGIYLTFIDSIIKKYNIEKKSLKFISAGDRYTLKNLGTRLMSCAGVIVRDEGITNKCSGISKLIEMGRYKPHLVDLLSIKGIGMKRGMKLYKAGVKRIQQFMGKDEEELADIMSVGIKTVTTLKENAGKVLAKKYKI